MCQLHCQIPMRNDPAPSYQLAALDLLGSLHALRDRQGRKVEWVPCMSTPYAFDPEAPMNVKRNAAQQCLTDCSALHDCEQTLERLGPDAAGVWAGRILPGRRARAAAAGGSSRRRVRVSAVTAPLPDKISILVIGD